MLPTQTGWDIGEVVDVVWHWQLVKFFFPCFTKSSHSVLVHRFKLCTGEDGLFIAVFFDGNEW